MKQKEVLSACPKTARCGKYVSRRRGICKFWIAEKCEKGVVEVVEWKK